ncbi:serine--tRNA ligase [Methylopila jiangsuensis]|uniref:Serine--tRNA ligase n=1 Tax=Methylopila jiangsuensis TaxID=586230 RepID=A0A9W6N3A2_9HYPH|nr:serine--tRNA ligase [Methylopila jiangsuensis]MDR6286094.1 seryl-tRNA synthetase [Methylopila jiangsuensis]GLK75852.1 serine--tRNA ligase [Methylopila jiangsuensis]
MHDIRLIRDNPDLFDRGLARRGLTPQSARLIAIDERRREVIGRLQALQERRNAASKEVGQAKAAKDEARAAALIAEVAQLKQDAPAAEAEQTAIEQELQAALSEIPNIPLDAVPDGPDETANVELHVVGEPRAIHDAKAHYELGEALGLIDFEAAARMSGARFAVLKGQVARLERALASFMLDLHTTEHGYTEIAPPLLVRDEAMFGTAQLPKFKDDQFQTGRGFSNEEFYEAVKIAGAQYRAAHGLDDTQENRYLSERAVISSVGGVDRLWLIPTAEVSLTNLVREQILGEDELPLRVTAGTPCFRAEAGAAGRDTRGLIRQHQFTKVELVSVTTPEKSLEEHERMLGCAEEVLKRLELPFRTITLCTGDMGFSSQKTYDIEVWLPAQNAYREISSCSVCGDFQARRMNARYRPADAKGPRFVHTLNGSGVAVGRALVAVLENYQQDDGSIAVPAALQPYMGGLTVIGRA